MARRKQKAEKAALKALKQAIAERVAHEYPGCEAVFIGQQSRAALQARTLGFRVRDCTTGRFRSNIIWIK